MFNVGSGEPVVLRDFLGEIADRLGADHELLRFGAIAMRAGEPPVCYPDISKARRLLGFNPTPLRAAIDRDLLGPA